MKFLLGILSFLLIFTYAAAVAQQSLPTGDQVSRSVTQAVPAEHSVPADPLVRTRWIVDVKEKLGFESFERISHGSKPWKGEQGISFLTADELAVFQLRKGSPPDGSGHSRFHLQVDVLDTRDGHEIKQLLLPAKSESGWMMHTRGGAFVVRAGDLLKVYSSAFAPQASRELERSTTATSQEWQVDVSPSGTKVIAVHQQEWINPKDKHADPESKADVEVLDAETLKTVQSFSLPYLDQWSAADDGIISNDPEGDDGNTDFGIMDFQGEWHGLHTTAQNDSRWCSYHMEALEHGLIVAHDCDDVVVVSNDGALVFSPPVRNDNRLIAIASEGDYVAEAMVPYYPYSSPQVSVVVYDIRKKASVAWASLGDPNIYFSLSPAGTLAVINGDKLKFFQPRPSIAESRAENCVLWDCL